MIRRMTATLITMPIISGITIKSLFLLSLAFFLTGCATTDNRIIQDIQDSDRDITQALNQCVGKLTYDQAISDFGAPDKLAEGSDVIVAEWLGQFDNFRLTFDKQTTLLKSYRFDSRLANHARAVQQEESNQRTANIARAFSKAFSPKETYVYKDSQGRQIGSVERQN